MHRNISTFENSRLDQTLLMDGNRFRPPHPSLPPPSLRIFQEHLASTPTPNRKSNPPQNNKIQKQNNQKKKKNHEFRQVKTACGRSWGGVYSGVDGGGDAGFGEERDGAYRFALPGAGMRERQPPGADTAAQTGGGGTQVLQIGL